MINSFPHYASRGGLRGGCEQRQVQNTLEHCPSERRMNLLILILIFIPLFSSPSSAQEFDLPEVIGFFRGTPEAETNFGSDFCWVGDQNGDGFDDLLVTHDPWTPNEPFFQHNRVELFYGGEVMDDEPDMLFSTEVEGMSFGHRINYLGQIDNERQPIFTINSILIAENPLEELESILSVYEGFEELDNEPEFSIRRDFETRALGTSLGHRNRPTDINGDGFDDFIAIQRIDDLSQIVIFYGAEEFDTIPDWSVINPAAGDWATNLIEYSSGLDINGDGYDDALIATYRNPDRFHKSHYSMFLGGDPPDTIPVFEFDYDLYDELKVNQGFSLLPDVNGDGFDDWGVYWYHEDLFRDGYYLFFGGENPDMEVDVELEGNHAIAVLDGDISGGDFNGDGFGDIVTGMSGGFNILGEIHIHFGRPNIREEADIVINAVRDYGEEFEFLGAALGATGDYNGDGIDDFVSRIDGHPPKIAVFAGNPDWVVNSVSNDLPDQFQLLFEANPNPFNAEVRLSLSLPYPGNVKMIVYDVYGRLVATVADSLLSDGRHDFMLNGGQLSSGVYFARLVFEGGGKRTGVFKKLVCLK